MNNSGRIARRFYLSLRLPALLLTLSLAMLLTACGGSSDETGSDPTNPSTGAGPDQSDIKGPVSLSWTAPEQRENGDELDITELGVTNFATAQPMVVRLKRSSLMIRGPWSTTSSGLKVLMSSR